MSNMEISRVLDQLKTLAGDLQPAAHTPATGKVDFGEVLKDSINNVSDMQAEGSALRNAFEAGQPDVDLTEVMIATQKASLSFQAMAEVRNKLVEAYRDIMNMPI
ncbi:MAG: flagellar hook-basal body complex protein FliE [Gammaproteobacteria bacterium]